MTPNPLLEREVVNRRIRRLNGAALTGNVLLLVAHLIWTIRGEARSSAMPPRRDSAVVRPESAAPPANAPSAEAMPVMAATSAGSIVTPAPESIRQSASADGPAPARTAGSYRIQVGVFRRQENALALVERLQHAGHAAAIEPYDRGALETWYRVHAGSFEDFAAAATALIAVQASDACDRSYIVCRSQTPVNVAVIPAADAADDPPDRWLEDDARSATPAADPAEIEREYEYAQSRQRRDDLNAALDSYRRVLALDPNHHAARCRLAGVYLTLGRRIEAESEIFLLREVMSDDPVFLFNAAWLDFEQRRTSQAHVELVRLLDREPDHLRGRLLLGSVFEARGDLERALLEYRHAQRLAPGDPAALYPLARTLDGVGLRDEALSVYEQFLSVPIAAHPWSEVRDAVLQRVTWLRRS